MSGVRKRMTSPRETVREQILKPDPDQLGHNPCECGEFTKVRCWRLLNALPSSASPILCKRCNAWMADYVATSKVAESFQREREGQR